MPANLPPQYFTIEKKLREARTPGEKISVVEELLTIIPKHKGTERLRGDYKRRLAKWREEQQQGKSKGKSAGGFTRVEREGAGQVALVGLANSGKSALLKALTKAAPEIAPYPFTTRFPLSGMMKFEDIQIQLIDLPPVSTEYTEPWFPEILRNADLWLLVLDLGQDPLAQMEEVRRDFSGFQVGLGGEISTGPVAFRVEGAADRHRGQQAGPAGRPGYVSVVPGIAHRVLSPAQPLGGSADEPG